jgi:hypothetical protein
MLRMHKAEVGGSSRRLALRSVWRRHIGQPVRTALAKAHPEGQQTGGCAWLRQLGRGSAQATSTYARGTIQAASSRTPCSRCRNQSSDCNSAEQEARFTPADDHARKVGHTATCSMNLAGPVALSDLARAAYCCASTAARAVMSVMSIRQRSAIHLNNKDNSTLGERCIHRCRIGCKIVYFDAFFDLHDQDLVVNLRKEPDKPSVLIQILRQ